MKRKLILFFISALVFQPILSQSYFIEDLFVDLSGNASDGDFSNSTYFSAIDSCRVNWRVISESIPNGWTFSFCFPNCYEPGVNTGSSLFLENSQQLLNCHIYPNNIPGTGVIEMEITTNETHKDTVVWSATAFDNLSASEMILKPRGNIVSIFNIEGKRMLTPIRNQISFIEYENGEVIKSVYVK